MIDKVLGWIGVGLYHAGLAKSVISLGRSNPKVLLFHDIAPIERDFVSGLGTTLTPAIFQSHLRFLAKHYDIVPIDRIAEAPSGRPRVSIAFDDGYRSIHTHAAPALHGIGANAIVYLITRAVDNVEPVWVNALNWHLINTGEPALAAAREAFNLPPSADSRRILAQARIDFDRERIAELIARLAQMTDRSLAEELATDPLYLSWAEVGELAGQGFQFGNHTATHPNMARLSDEEQADEIGEAQAVLAGHGIATDHFAYPFGHHNDSTAGLARRHGLKKIAEVGGGNGVPGSEFIGRVDVTAKTTSRLFAQLEVIEPVKAQLRKILGKPKAGWA